MKNGLSMMLLLLSAGATSGWAAPLCTSGTLTSYVTSGFSCMIGDKTFSGFGALLFATQGLGSAGPGTLDGITVVPGGDSLNPTLGFQAAYTASGLVANETLTVTYTVTGTPTSSFIGANLSLTSAAVTGLAAITGAEALCLGGSFTNPLANPLVCSTGVSVNLGLLSDITNANLGATVQYNFAPVQTLGVIKQITLTGAAAGTATAASLNNGLTADDTSGSVPEPSTLMLLSIGIPMVYFMRKRTAPGGSRNV